MSSFLKQIPAIFLPVILLLLGYVVVEAVFKIPDVMTGWTRAQLKYHAELIFMGYMGFCVVFSLILVIKIKFIWRKILALIVSLFSIGTVGAYLYVQNALFPDEFCFDFTMVSKPSESVYEELDRADFGNYRYVLYADARGYAGETPLPMIGIDYSPIKEPRVKRCYHHGTLFEHFWNENDDIKIKSGAIYIKSKTVKIRFKNGKSQTFSIQKDLPK